MGNSLLAVREINHKYIVEGKKERRSRTKDAIAEGREVF